MEHALGQLIACCRFAYERSDAARLRSALTGADPSRLLTLAERHRVEGLLWTGLRNAEILLPGLEPLAERARRLAVDGLRIAAESQRLHRALAAASLPHLFLKGQPLGRQAWGHSFVKRQVDIDLLVTPDSLGKVAPLLGALGYVQETPDPSVDPLDWHRRVKESSLRSDDGTLLDLHTRVADNKALLPQVTATTTPAMVEVAPGIALPTLPPSVLLPYLAVHGCSSAWFRLKWLADFAAIVHQTPHAEIERLAERAPRMGAGRCLSVGLVLAHRLFGTFVPDALWFDTPARRLVRISLAQLSNSIEPTDRRLGTVGIHLSQLLMAPGKSFFWGELLRQAASALTHAAPPRRPSPGGAPDARPPRLV